MRSTACICEWQNNEDGVRKVQEFMLLSLLFLTPSNSVLCVQVRADISFSFSFLFLFFGRSDISVCTCAGVSINVCSYICRHD